MSTHFGTFVLKSDKEIHIKFFVSKCDKVPPIVYYHKHFHNYSINVGSNSFFSSSDTRQSHHLLECHARGINSSFNSFSSALRFLNLIRQSKVENHQQLHQTFFELHIYEDNILTW